ncbi:hypothetical protein D3C85_1128130 [compost metagenome]
MPSYIKPFASVGAFSTPSNIYVRLRKATSICVPAATATVPLKTEPIVKPKISPFTLSFIMVDPPFISCHSSNSPKVERFPLFYSD